MLPHMTISTFKEPIWRQIVLFIFFFLTILGGVLVSQTMMQKELSSVISLRKNELERIEMSYLIHIDLQKIQSLFQNMSMCRTEYELDYFDKQIQATIIKIQEFINIIGNGGTGTYTYKVNFGNEEEIQRSFTYRNQRQSELSLDTFELSSKVKTLIQNESKIKELLEQRLTLTDPELRPQLEQKILFFYKGVDPYFQRIFENSYRIYFNAQKEMQRLHVLVDQTVKKNALQFRIFLAIAGLLMTALTGKVLLNIKRILRERNAFQQELKLSNDGLEQTILERTWKLQDEVEERLRAEEKEHQQAVFLKTIIDSLAHPFYVVDVETYEIKMLNDSARQLNPEHHQFCYTLTHHRKDPCNCKDHPCPLIDVKRTGQPVTLEHIHYNHAGEKIYVEVHGYPVFDADGNVIQMIEYNLDVTDRKLAEMALAESHKNLEATVTERTANLQEEIEKRQKIQAYFQESEHYYRTLIESSNDLITIIDENGTITYASPSILRMLGYTPEYIEGKNLYDFLHPDDVRFGRDKFGAFLTSLVPEKRLEHRILASDGQYRVLDSSFHNLLHDKAINGLLLTARDITAKREAEALMRKLQLVIEQSPHSVIITNKDGNIEYVNPQFEVVTGYSRAEVLGQNPRILNSGLTPFQTFQAMWNAISQGKIWQGELANRNKNGALYYENVVIAPLKNELDEITHYVAMKENITELKKAREQAEASNKAKSEFLSRMSHELRTPLNAINGFSKLLLGSKTSPLAPRQQEQVLQINTAGHYLLALINEILDLSRIESGKLALSITSIQPASGINNCLALVESLAFNSKVSIHIDATIQGLPALKADPTRFQQVMLNLLSNAIKYNRPGGTVTITGAVEEKMACIRVIDTGIGIAPDKQKEIFIPFTRLGQDNSLVEGTGIGMTITKQLVELMQGTIDCTSIPGIGSTFEVALPLASYEDQTINVSAPTTEQIDLVAKAATILYIEDNADDISRMRKLMAQWPQASLVIRKTAVKGLQSVEMLNPDHIILNIDLFNTRAEEVISSLQQSSQTQNIPIVALGLDAIPDTANNLQDVLQRLGCYDYLTKPMDASKLHAILTTVLKEEKK